MTANGTFADVIHFLVVQLLKPDKELIDKEIEDLIDLNNIKLGVNYTGCSYGKYYLERGGRIVQNLAWKPFVDPSLESRVKGLPERALAIRQDYEYIKDIFTQMVIGDRNWQDFRNSLPDCVIQFHPQLRNIPRTLNVEANIRSNKPLKFKYDLLLPRLHTYSMMSLLT